MGEFSTFLTTNKSSEKFLLRLTLFTLFTANDWNFSISTAID